MEEEKKQKPILIAMEDIKAKVAEGISAGISDGVPAFLIEGVLCEYLAEVRKIKCDELSNMLRLQNTEENNG